MLLRTAGQRVRATRLRKSFGDVAAVRNLSFDIEPGELVTFLGPSGCGKTTTLKMIAGLTPTHGGEIYFGESRVDHLPPNKRNVGLVFQNYSLFPHLTVSENIAYGLKMRHWAPPHRIARVEEMLALVRLEGLGNRRPSQLSGGQQQRVAMARALAFNPDILLLDEPLSNLDARLRDDLRLDLREIQRRTRQTTIFVTHDQDEALILSDRIVLMNDGVAEQIDTPEQLYSMPATEFAARFIGANNVIYGTYTKDGDADLVRVAGIARPLPASTKAPAVGPTGSSVAACVRPEQIIVRPQNQTLEASAYSTLARITDIVYNGGSIILHLAVPGLGTLKCQRPAMELQGLVQGSRVAISILDCHLVPHED